MCKQLEFFSPYFTTQITYLNSYIVMLTFVRNRYNILLYEFSYVILYTIQYVISCSTYNKTVFNF